VNRSEQPVCCQSTLRRDWQSTNQQFFRCELCVPRTPNTPTNTGPRFFSPMRVQGYALVEYGTKGEAQAAIDEMDGKEILGQTVKVSVFWGGGGDGGPGLFAALLGCVCCMWIGAHASTETATTICVQKCAQASHTACSFLPTGDLGLQ
jgi:hypothetical protein